MVGLAGGPRPVLTGGLALTLVVILDTVSCWRALPTRPWAVRPRGDGVAGGWVPYDVVVTPGRRPVTLARRDPHPGARRRPPYAGVLVPPGRAGSAARAELDAEWRGLYAHESFAVLARGPLGLVTGRRDQTVHHERPVAVGPAPVAHDVRWPAVRAAAPAGEARPTRGDELVRGVRAYTRGDTRRSVHWPATARHGSLMVRETDGAGARHLRVVVSFAEPGAGAEQALGRASWLVTRARRDGWEVTLVTCEPGDGTAGARTVDRPVGSDADLVRRLAAAGPGHPRARSRGPGVGRSRPGGTRWITPEEDRWT